MYILCFLVHLADYLERGLSILHEERNILLASKFVANLKSPSVVILDSLYDTLERHNMVEIYLYLYFSTKLKIFDVKRRRQSIIGKIILMLRTSYEVTRHLYNLRIA